MRTRRIPGLRPQSPYFPLAQVKLKQLDSKIRYENKRVVESLVARLCAEWEIRGVIARMLPPIAGLQRLQYYAQATSGDSSLPSCELPGLSFMLQGKKVWGGSLTRKWLQEGMQ